MSYHTYIVSEYNILIMITCQVFPFFGFTYFLKKEMGKTSDQTKVKIIPYREGILSLILVQTN